MQIASDIHRIGDRSIINAYLIEEANEVTLVDAGVAGLYRDLPKELASIGRTIEDVRALVLTHGHSDHIGFAERLRTERHVPVSVHEADAALARGEVPNPSKGFGPTKVGPLLGFLWFSLLRGGLRTRHLGEVATFGDGATLDVPGSPVVTLTPGHTPGSAVLHFRSLGALVIGDAFATYAVTTGARGPGIAPFTADAARAVESLARMCPQTSSSPDTAIPGPEASRKPFGWCASLLRRAFRADADQRRGEARRGRRALRITGRAGLRRATSRNPAWSNMDLAPKNMSSGWLRSSLSTG
jgi:glyoxylase-like metal-dependent hydrolase (beta-lactamase superfamily II)